MIVVVDMEGPPIRRSLHCASGTAPPSISCGWVLRVRVESVDLGVRPTAEMPDRDPRIQCRGHTDPMTRSKNRPGRAYGSVATGGSAAIALRSGPMRFRGL